MKTFFYSLLLVIFSASLTGCEADTIENETIEGETIETSNIELSAIDKDEAETVGTRD
ncbi:hypothetical protein [Aquimarina macrocephali]|uniref:hypothetical protein n=1 Tax=Aquimarina macrocephali TaxID=666563 RepID=UPI0004B8C888|nr:hypothetical protein [Aquimarina macrocephali]